MENTIYHSTITNMVTAESLRLSDDFNINQICTSLMSSSKKEHAIIITTNENTKTTTTTTTTTMTEDKQPQPK